MTVKELIVKLNEIKDKSVQIFCYDDMAEEGNKINFVELIEDLNEETTPYCNGDNFHSLYPSLKSCVVLHSNHPDGDWNEDGICDIDEYPGDDNYYENDDYDEDLDEPFSE